MKTTRVGLLLAGLLSCTLAAAEAPPAGDAVRGAEVFTAQCAACHLAKEGQSAPIGPQLYGVVGRRAGSWDGFKYTEAMKKSGFTWNRELLDKYLMNPYSLVPGAAMGLLVPIAVNRADVIAYLESKPELLKHPEPKP